MGGSGVLLHDPVREENRYPENPDNRFRSPDVWVPRGSRRKKSGKNLDWRDFLCQDRGLSGGLLIERE
jgi:hypothetical protein